MTVMIGTVSFAGMFAFAWFTTTTPQAQIPEAEQTTSAQPQARLQLTPPHMSTTSGLAAVDSTMKKAMTEKQLKSLVFEVREKIQEYDDKLGAVKIREQRLQRAQGTLKTDIEELNNLRIELETFMVSLKSEQDKLLKSRVAIAKAEKNNLVSIAAFYDKMAPESAGEILTNISQAKNSSADDAVKILHYMSDRTKAKVLASIAESKEPAISAYFCQKLKQIIEKE
jgi:hypothetical protein